MSAIHEAVASRDVTCVHVAFRIFFTQSELWLRIGRPVIDALL